MVRLRSPADLSPVTPVHPVQLSLVLRSVSLYLSRYISGLAGQGRRWGPNCRYSTPATCSTEYCSAGQAARPALSASW